MSNPAISNKQQALWQQGQRHTQHQQWRQAAASYEAIVEHDHSFLPAWLELSTAREKLDAYRESFHAVLAASKVDGVPPMAGLAVARRLRRFEALPELQAYIERTGLAMTLSPEKLIDLASFFASAGDHGKTLIWIEHALKLRPDLAEAHNMHGLVLMFAGRPEESVAAFERALKIRPTFAAVYSVLSRVAKNTPERNRVDTLRKMLAQPNLTAKDEGHLGYALHNELHDLGDHDGAWQALTRACRARRVEQPYDHAQTMAVFDALRSTFDAEFSRGEPMSPMQVRPILFRRSCAMPPTTSAAASWMRRWSSAAVISITRRSAAASLTPCVPADAGVRSSPRSRIRTSSCSARSPRRCRRRGCCTCVAIRPTLASRTCARCSPTKRRIPTIKSRWPITSRPIAI
jgi:tetratricopeptide (TPR) repeat protein